jgi:hypothetical protein
VAQEVLLREGQEEVSVGTMVVPFAFYNEATDLSIGLSIGRRGVLQPQTSVFATAVTSLSGTTYGFLALRDLRAPWSERIYVDAQLNLGTFSEIDIYSDGNPAFPEERAGSHGSDEDNFLKGEGTDYAGWLGLFYVLPIGAGLDAPESRLTLRDGLVLGGGRDTSTWNPFRGGYTVLGLKPFFRTQNVELEEMEARDVSTVGTEFILNYENTDFSVNPSRGGALQLRYTRDWGALDSSVEWDTLDLRATRYFSLGEGRRSRQRVLALNAWAIDTLSWNDYDSENGRRTYHRPPSFAGASLGGLSRMRGYPEGRFNDRSAVYYSAEYRHIPDWNPLRDASLLRRINVRVDWVQFVLGLEVGRVADEFNLGTLHSDMNVGTVVGFRAMVNHLVVRMDVGLCDEGMALQMTIDHPF